jgi:hypothetical protein
MAKSRTTPSFVSPSYAVGLSVLVWRQETADRSVSSQGPACAAPWPRAARFHPSISDVDAASFCGRTTAECCPVQVDQDFTTEGATPTRNLPTWVQLYLVPKYLENRHENRKEA